MKKSVADKFFNQQLQSFIDKAETAETEEEAIKFTEAAANIYMALASCGGFDNQELQADTSVVGS